MCPHGGPSGRMDLHVHTDRSDGRFSPERVLQKAMAARLDAIALTDHDLPPPVAPGIHRRDGESLRVIGGSEVTTCHEGTELHLLVYFPEPVPAAATAFLVERARLRCARLAEAGRRLGLADSWLDADALAGHRTVTRLTLARHCVAAGRIRSTEEAFRTVLAPEAGVLEPVDLPFLDALGILVPTGGITSWAHPTIEQAQAYLRLFARFGLHAVETLRPGIGRHTRVALRRMAERLGLLQSGGSDWHGFGPQVLGSFAVRREQVAPLLSKLDGAPRAAEIVSSEQVL
jgi:3',5'-nucleoside bisphosphate phosphatase